MTATRNAGIDSGGGSLEERDFWVRLEYRVCAEFQDLADSSLHYFWCDGLIAEQYDQQDGELQVRGTAWIGHGDRQERWRFVLQAGQPPADSGGADWAALLPDDNLSGWLAA